jgi:hypothetical protein
MGGECADGKSRVLYVKLVTLVKGAFSRKAVMCQRPGMFGRSSAPGWMGQVCRAACQCGGKVMEQPCCFRWSVIVRRLFAVADMRKVSGVNKGTAKMDAFSRAGLFMVHDFAGEMGKFAPEPERKALSVLLSPHPPSPLLAADTSFPARS